MRRLISSVTSCFSKIRKTGSLLAGVLATACFLFTFQPTPALATYCCTCCNCCEQADTADIAEDAYEEYRDDFIADEFYNDVVEDDFRDWASQLSATIAMQWRMIGGFYDAQAHLDAQRDLQKLAAEAIRDYTPSEAVCKFGTLSASLAASDQKSRTNQLLFSEMYLARNLGRFGNISSEGRGNDQFNRINQFVLAFCDPTDEGGAMRPFCNATPPPEFSSRLNRDLDYTRTLGILDTINADRTDAYLTNVESDLVMLGYNLYGNSQFNKRADRSILTQQGSQEVFQLTRSIAAKRSLAQNTFNAIAGMKSTGTDAGFVPFDSVLTSLGMSVPDRDTYFGVTPLASGGLAAITNASYYAQMEVLTKRLYQNPAFYAELMDKEANVSRQNAAMEGLELMQDRDIFNSMSRTEQLLALLVEMEAIKLQSTAENKRTTQ